MGGGGETSKGGNDIDGGDEIVSKSVRRTATKTTSVKRQGMQAPLQPGVKKIRLVEGNKEVTVTKRRRTEEFEDWPVDQLHDDTHMVVFNKYGGGEIKECTKGGVGIIMGVMEVILVPV